MYTCTVFTKNEIFNLKKIDLALCRSHFFRAILLAGINLVAHT